MSAGSTRCRIWISSLEALARLQEAGWRVALRFEPIIPVADYLSQYRELFKRVFGALNAARLRSVSLGEFRMPEKRFHRDIVKLYPWRRSSTPCLRLVEDGLLRLEGWWREYARKAGNAAARPHPSQNNITAVPESRMTTSDPQLVIVAGASSGIGLATVANCCCNRGLLGTRPKSAFRRCDY